MLTENGWPSCGYDGAQWGKVPGTDVSLQIQKGIPYAILMAYAADYNAYVEPLRDADSASWTATNSVATSNHLGGTAMDLNWNSHPFQIPDAGYSPAMIATMRELLDFYEGTVFWANDWDSPKDAMHHQLGYDTYNNQNRLRDFIARKIRPDGFSTFRRENAQPPARTIGLTADVLADAMGNALPLDRYRQLLPAFAQAMQQAQINTVQRAAMWCAQLGTESGGLRWMREIASGAEYEGRADLGNTQAGDGVRYAGRGPIQITGRGNYTRLSQWAHSRGYVPTATYFVDYPAQLESDRYGFLGAVWYWTVARPNINGMCDAGDLNGVTRAINGGLNGIDDRRARYQRCLALGQALLPTGGFLMALTDAQQDRVNYELTNRFRSIYVDPDTGKQSDFADTLVGYVLQADVKLETMRLQMAKQDKIIAAMAAKLGVTV